MKHDQFDMASMSKHSSHCKHCLRSSHDKHKLSKLWLLHGKQWHGKSLTIRNEKWALEGLHGVLHSRLRQGRPATGQQAQAGQISPLGHWVADHERHHCGC